MSDAGPVDEQAEARIAELRRRWEEKPSPRAGLQLAEELRRASRLEESKEILERSLDENPGHLSSLVALGKTRLGLGDPAGAARNFEQVVDRDPTHLVANKLLIEAHLQQSDAENARRRLEHYSLLNAGDPEMESLEARIAELALGAERPDSDGEELAGASTAKVEQVLEPPEMPAEVAAAADLDGSVVRASSPAGETDPFPNLGSGEQQRYLDGLQAAGIFPLPEESAIAEEATPEAEPFDDAEPEIAPAAARVLEPDAEPVAEPIPEPDPEPAPAAEAEPVPEGARPAEAESEHATATLGELYLAQGHPGDAARVFRQVLEREPHDESAAAGLAEALRQQEQSGLDAPALLRWATEAGAVSDEEIQDDRRRALLEAYRARLRSRGEGEEGTDVP